MFSQEMDETELDYHTLQNYKWVAGSVEMSRRRDNLSFSHHEAIAKLNPSEQIKILEEAENEKLDVHDLRQKVREQNKLPTPELPKGKYQVIYADPPWQYAQEQHSHEKQDTTLETHYPTMPTEEIAFLIMEFEDAEKFVKAFKREAKSKY
jgi:16S rRNA G966 N2-methylase RsmD